MFLILRHSIAGTELPLSCGPVQHLKRERADIVATRPRIRARTANICSVRPPAVTLYRTYRGCADPKWDKEKKKEPPLPAARKLYREASNRVDRSHSMSRRWTILVMKGKA